MQKNNQIEFTDLYASIVASRVAISSILSPDITDEIRRERKKVNFFSYTNIGSTGTYKDFHQFLLAEFDRLADIYPVQIYSPLNPFIYGFGETVEIQESRELLIGYNETEYTTLINHKLTDTEYVTAEEEWITILHTSVLNIPVLMNTVRSLYNSLLAAANDADKIAIIKEMAWHLAHAMSQSRGSAAISEILTEALLRHHGIAYTASRPAMPMGLVALFSATPQEFAKRMHFNLELESAPQTRGPVSL